MTVLLLEDVSIYIKALQIGGSAVAPVRQVGLHVFVDLIIFPFWELLFSSSHIIFHR